MNKFDLPKNAKTLLKTPANKIVTKQLTNGGKYWHFGLTKILDTINVCGFPMPETVELNVFTDGLSLFSNNTELWPILCSIEKVKLAPMVIGIYYGKKKPGCVEDYSATDEFLDEFLSEAAEFYENGYSSGTDHHHQVVIKKFINDVPAAALIKKTRGHTGFYSCTKCDTPGTDIPRSSVKCFPFYGENRTDHSFRNEEQPQHHNETSLIAVTLPQVDMVADFPLDYMHLVCLGIVRKSILFWVDKPSEKSNKLGIEKINAINDELLQNRSNIPDDFNRKNFNLHEVKHWKATQFRTFILYFGVVVLKDNLDQKRYDHFLQLHTVVSICSAEEHFNYLDVAELISKQYVQLFSDIYGYKTVSKNVHNIGHIVNDVKRFGILENFSAFEFENQIGVLKKLVRTGNLPLEQVCVHC